MQTFLELFKMAKRSATGKLNNSAYDLLGSDLRADLYRAFIYNALQDLYTSIEEQEARNREREEYYAAMEEEAYEQSSFINHAEVEALHKEYQDECPCAQGYAVERHTSNCAWMNELHGDD